MTHARIRDALEKGAAGERIGREDAFAMIEAITPDTVHALGRSALANRTLRFGNHATYVFNIHVNPSNICCSGCTFCNYAAGPDDPHAYVLEEDDIFREIETTGPVEAHIVGGLNTVWPYRRNLNLVSELRRRFPGLHIKAYTAVEIAYFAKTAGEDVLSVLKALKAAGMDAMPGGGAEIFSERLHRIHWKNKVGPDDWLRIHELAHSLGIPSNATMLFGLGETWAERIDHLLRLREAQDRSGGFECFIPLAFQPGPGATDTEGPTPMEALAVIALSRLILDNIPHIKSYWPMIGLETAAAGLSWGADDMDGTIHRERIAHLAGATTPRGLAKDQMVDTIRTAGFIPVERDGRFRPRMPREA
ncbi:MAG: radical SAM protein [Desulfobacterales bacterium]